MFNMLNYERDTETSTKYRKEVKMGYNIKELREELGMSQEDLSTKAGVSRTIISGLETGRITVTTTETLKKISAALGKKIGDIFFD